jgi:hypothetical protein
MTSSRILTLVIAGLSLVTEAARCQSPSARAGAVMTYDASRRVILLFGGMSRDGQGQPVYPDDLWAWDGSTWLRLDPPAGSPRPPGRDAAALVFDESRGRAVLIGGRREDESLGEGTDVWEWDGHQWSRIANPGFPYLLHAFAAYDPVGRRVLLFGGGRVSPSGAFAGMSRTLYEWKGEGWVNRDSLGPDSSYVGGLVVNPAGDVIALMTDGSGRPGGSRAWSWSGTWVPRETTPPFRNLQPTASSPDGTLYFFQSWDERLNLPPALHIRAADGSWTRVPAESGPGNRGSQSAAWDAERRRLVVFGGRTAQRVDVNETWEFDGTGWERRP